MMEHRNFERGIKARLQAGNFNIVPHGGDLTQGVDAHVFGTSVVPEYDEPSVQHHRVTAFCDVIVRAEGSAISVIELVLNGDKNFDGVQFERVWYEGVEDSYLPASESTDASLNHVVKFAATKQVRGIG